MSRLPAPENPVPEPAKDKLDIARDSVVPASLDYDGKDPVVISSLSKDEPIVTRKELWSYYCESAPLFVPMR